jgi:hypothetical protein
MRVPLPREHGAWVMTTLALVSGWNVGAPPAGGSTLLATFSVVRAFLAQAAWLDLAAPRWIWKTESVLSALLSLVVAWRLGAGFALVAAVAAGFGLLAQCLRERERVAARVRLAAFGAHLAGAAALSGVAALVMASRSVPFQQLIWASWILGLGFGGGVLFVQAIMPGRHRSLVPLLLLACVAAITVGIGFWQALEGPRTLLALVPVFVRVSLVPRLRRRGLAWKTAGWMETAFGIWSVVWLIGAFE